MIFQLLFAIFITKRHPKSHKTFDKAFGKCTLQNINKSQKLTVIIYLHLWNVKFYSCKQFLKMHSTPPPSIWRVQICLVSCSKITVLNFGSFFLIYVVYLDQQTHACACVHMVENNEKRLPFSLVKIHNIFTI